MRSFRTRRRISPVDWLVVGLGNPGSRYQGTRHNVGFEIAAALATRWQLPRPRKAFGGLLTSGRVAPGGPRVAVLLPQTYMNESGGCVGPARGQLKVELDHLLVIHDEIDLPFGQIQDRKGGGLAGHNGLRSLKQHLGSAEFLRLRVGVGRPESTDPEVVSAYVLARFSESPDQVRALIAGAVEHGAGIIAGRAQPAG